MKERARVGNVPFYGRGQQSQLRGGRDAAQRHSAVGFVGAKLLDADLIFAHVYTPPSINSCAILHAMGEEDKEAVRARVEGCDCGACRPGRAGGLREFARLAYYCDWSKERYPLCATTAMREQPPWR